jgi:hypothetical protein
VLDLLLGELDQVLVDDVADMLEIGGEGDDLHAAPAAGLAQHLFAAELRQVDLDTKSKYSDVRSVLGLTESKGLLVYPNPSENGTVNIVFSESNVIRDIAIIDLSGRTLKQMNGVVNNNIRIDNLQTGMYTLRVVVPATGEQMTEKLVVNKR